MTEIKQIDFSILSSENIRKYSVLEITSHDLFEKGVPKSGGLCDLRMGTIDRQYICQTCKNNALNCPGHFGHIELAQPVIHVLYYKYIYKILQCVCLKCSNLLIDTDIYTNNNKEQYKQTVDLCKHKRVCTVCDILLSFVV